MRALLVIVVGAIFAFGLVGCNVSKPYITETKRTDQQLAGNRGYLKGTPPLEEDTTGRKRQFLTVDIDLPQIAGKPTQETKLVAPGGLTKVTDTINAAGRDSSGTGSSESEANIK